VFNEVCSETGDVCGETVAYWVAKLPSIMDGYEPKDIAEYSVLTHTQLKTNPDSPSCADNFYLF
jgi:hypothetical protein